MSIHVQRLYEFFKSYFILNDIDQFRFDKLFVIDDNFTGYYDRAHSTIDISNLLEVIELSIKDKVKPLLRNNGCRFFSFGYDYDAWLCSKHSDIMPEQIDGLSVIDISADLINTDWYDG